MADGHHPAVFTIAAHRAFADALAAGLLDRAGDDRLALARGLVLLPTNRAVRALTEAFVRLAGDQGVLLPRLVAVGDMGLAEAAGLGLGASLPEMPPVVDDCARTMILARLVRAMRTRVGDPIPAGEAVRLACQLGGTLDELLDADVPPSALAALVPHDLAHHWESTLTLLRIVVEAWPAVLAERGEIDAVAARGRMFDLLARQWRDAPPAGFVVVAGLAGASPALARLIHAVARLPQGLVVLPGVDLAMPREEWDALGPDCAEPGMPKACETHPQHQLKRLLDGIGVGRDEIRIWPRAGGRDGPPGRSRAIQRAMAPAAFTGSWRTMTARERRLSGVRFVETATPAAEAQAIALELRRVLDTPGRTAALVTPDRLLARRVAAHLGRWGIGIDDSAGRPLSRTPPGVLLRLVAVAAASGFAPVATLALLKHPLVRAGEERAAWLDGVRTLDKALRGPRPAPGLAGIADRLREASGRWLADEERAAALLWWDTASALLVPLESAFADKGMGFSGLLTIVNETASALAGDALWAGPAGRAASGLVQSLQNHGDELDGIAPGEMPGLLGAFMDEVAVRPVYGRHPRLAIYGLLESRLQRADLMILGGLNEGVWPGTPAPDPWLAPRLRNELKLPGLEQRIGQAAHDLVQAMGAPQVLVTRARRDVSAPTVASRFWLRLQAMTGGVPRQPELAGWAAAIDRPDRVTPASRPAPAPPAALRPRRIAVTAVDRLKADPFAFYARAMLRLDVPDRVDAEPSAAERGNAVHDILEKWLALDGGRPEALAMRARQMIAGWHDHPLLRRLWGPRVLRAVEWTVAAMAEDRAAGWTPAGWEVKGRADLAGIALEGRADRIDRRDGEIGIIDYKSGRAPSTRQVEAGFALQLGLLGWLAQEGAFAGIAGTATRFDYWRLGGGQRTPGERIDPRLFRGRMVEALDDLPAFAAAQFMAVAADYLKGDKPFVAKLHPDYAVGADYDHLARVDEWLGRGRG